jgi:hypothetical protein
MPVDRRRLQFSPSSTILLRDLETVASIVHCPAARSRSAEAATTAAAQVVAADGTQGRRMRGSQRAVTTTQIFRLTNDSSH